MPKKCCKKQTVYAKGEYVNFRLLNESKPQFELIQAHLQARLGIKVSKAAVLRHCIAATYQMLNNQVGVK